jgi:hypothetical protein
MNIKIINVSQAYVHQFKNLKTKLYNCNANIFFNKECLKHNLIPNYTRSTKHNYVLTDCKREGLPLTYVESFVI